MRPTYISDYKTIIWNLSGEDKLSSELDACTQERFVP